MYCMSSNPPSHKVKCDPLIKRQLASRKSLWGLMWCKFGHVTPQTPAPTKPAYFTEWRARVQCDRAAYLSHACITPSSPKTTFTAENAEHKGNQKASIDCGSGTKPYE